jgi:hypothetical protein
MGFHSPIPKPKAPEEMGAEEGGSKASGKDHVLGEEAWQIIKVI